MWLIPFTEGESHWLRIDFDAETELAGMRIWNYNKNPEDTFRGVSSLILLPRKAHLTLVIRYCNSQISLGF